jgi:hypothetical protein
MRRRCWHTSTITITITTLSHLHRHAIQIIGLHLQSSSKNMLARTKRSLCEPKADASFYNSEHRS